MNPRPLGSVGGLKGADFVIALQCQSDLVETFKQAGAAAWINLETMDIA